MYYCTELGQAYQLRDACTGKVIDQTPALQLPGEPACIWLARRGSLETRAALLNRRPKIVVDRRVTNQLD